MFELILGFFGFALFIIYDLEQAGYVSKAHHKGVKFFFAVGFFLIFIATFLSVLKQMEHFSFCSLSLLGLIISCLFLFLLIYTLFFALSFEKTYVEQSTGRPVYSEGVYALCRHPGLLWFSGLYISLWLVFGGKQLFCVMLVFILLNSCYVFIQDRYIFPKIFTNYMEYQKSVPFLFPTKKSILDCLNLFK